MRECVQFLFRENEELYETSQKYPSLCYKYTILFHHVLLNGQHGF